ncbi:aromatic ring hydroxylase [Candidatus Shapirobacteria bacterium CG08_land_8_20_14_0_20_39_18]|uniref:Aromatic ring hydroxylase n=1 Tax=Candidatus Shapirobacteria bacterium CG08_land_8_20_14_0_20_39_18 TaxID=1974883 RepID=A0A2M6XE04_9BACT|nr:MAG: aromatic ring hydroxylase [Candidatus Shapirobacteria bacterium CG08_land_8_20_14_0_20_39_18]PIY64759.1 MAG: aromatic ring hydroxylase [Candidatus Shapirobacteria bacterium CG_4_10_14_0_8_um_filter_39_15]PJE67940.1 MAG: aromatic ring hydroxylase [Candidatus Shapirobacteria bacterium CG10_big_fil_rev_8_21_14_0_10_38_8]
MIDKNDVLKKLQSVMDPEIGYSIVDLGLIYGIKIDQGRVEIRMTLTAPACPLAQIIGDDIEKAVKKVNGVKEVKVNIVSNPPWSPEKMTPSLRKKMGF